MTNTPKRSTATQSVRTFTGPIRAVIRGFRRSPRTSTRNVTSTSPRIVSSIPTAQSKVSRVHGVVLPGERPWLSLSFDDFTKQFERIEYRVNRHGGSGEKHLIAYLAACDPDRCRANYLLEANYVLLEKYFDGNFQKYFPLSDCP